MLSLDQSWEGRSWEEYFVSCIPFIGGGDRPAHPDPVAGAPQGLRERGTLCCRNLKLESR